jgi:preprotein translocase subunit SecD
VRSREIYSLILVLVITGLSIWINFSGLDRFAVRQGLDLQGGIQVLLRADKPNATADEISTAAQVIERRVNALGVGETVVQRAGTDRIIVELPGVDNPEQAVESLRGTGSLEFIDSQGQNIPEGTVVRTTGNPDPPQLRQPLVLSDTQTTDQGPIYTSITDGADLDTNQVSPTFSQGGSVGNRPAVSFAFTGQSATSLAQFTSANVGQPMCIVLDSTIISCPVVNAPLVDGTGIIETNTRTDSERIYNQLKFGALPVPLQVETSRTISATLGQESVERSIVAGVVGLTMVALFMILYYRLPGLVAVVALGVYTLITFAFYRLVPITLTLPGIAGFILSIGLAVDENVLIFARIKEEFRRSKSLRASLEPGFDDSWSAIRDSAIATLITSLVLYMFGNSFGLGIIKGFALTLGVGTIFSVFTAVVVTRTLLRLLAPFPFFNNPWLFVIDEIQPRPADVPAKPETV